MKHCMILITLKIEFGWLVGFGFNGPLRQYFNIGPSPKEREKEERTDS